MAQIDGTDLRRRREASGINAGTFARLAGVSPGYLTRIEQGTRNPRPEVLARIAAALDVAITDLLTQERVA